jgi:hypothetical protein
VRERIVRFNSEGIDGFGDRPGAGPKRLPGYSTPTASSSRSRWAPTTLPNRINALACRGLIPTDDLPVPDAIWRTQYWVTRAQEAFPLTRFTDVEALVYLLKAVPWQVPGVSVDAHLPQLAEMDREIATTGALLVHAHRFLLSALPGAKWRDSGRVGGSRIHSPYERAHARRRMYPMKSSVRGSYYLQSATLRKAR